MVDVEHRGGAGASPRAVLIAGPTASGKSALALALAERTGGIVVNADSMQVYRDLRVLTARPSPEEEARASHRLYGSVDGAETFSVARWLSQAARLLGEAEGALPILVGGTGLYFKALTQGLSDIPPVPDAVRERVRADAQDRATPALHADLAARDPAMAARLRPSDRQRVLRALEVFEGTGRSLSHWQGRAGAPILEPQAAVRLFLAPERDALRAHIDRRFDAMMAEGALEEARVLASRGLDPDLPVMRAHGVPGLLAHLRGELSLGEAMAKGKADTRAYAKRQLTWFRNGMPGWTWANPRDGLDTATHMLATMSAGAHREP